MSGDGLLGPSFDMGALVAVLDFQAFREDIDFNEVTLSRAKTLRRVAVRHEKRLGALFEIGAIAEAQFMEAVQLEEDLHVFIECGERPKGLTATA